MGFSIFIKPDLFVSFFTVADFAVRRDTTPSRNEAIPNTNSLFHKEEKDSLDAVLTTYSPPMIAPTSADENLAGEDLSIVALIARAQNVPATCMSDDDKPDENIVGDIPNGKCWWCMHCII